MKILALLLFALSCQAQYGGFRRVKFSLRTDIEAHWDFEEGAGSTVGDISGNGHTGTASGMTWAAGRTSGNAGSFDGVNDTVKKDAAVVTAYPFTVSVWYNNTASSPNGTFFWTGDSSTYQPADYLFISTTTQLTLRQRRGSVDFNGINAVKAGIDTGWHHAVMCLDSVDRSIYIDGNLISSDAIAPAFGSPLNRWSIGYSARSTPEKYFEGKIDDVRIHTRVLTGPEIYELSIRE